VQPLLRIFLPLFSAYLLAEFVFMQDREGEISGLRRGLCRAALAATLGYLLAGCWRAWPIPAAIFLLHGLIDGIWIRQKARRLPSFLAEHAAHFFAIILIALLPLLIPSMRPAFRPAAPWLRPAYFALLTLLSGILLTVQAGSQLIDLAVKPFLDQMQAARRALQPEGVEGQDLIRQGFVQGGRVIGQLERALILLFVLVDQPAGVGFLIAAKSLLRFGEIRENTNRMEAEYIIIGTLASFLWGLIVAYGTRWALSLS